MLAVVGFLGNLPHIGLADVFFHQPEEKAVARLRVAAAFLVLHVRLIVAVQRSHPPQQDTFFRLALRGASQPKWKGHRSFLTKSNQSIASIPSN